MSYYIADYYPDGKDAMHTVTVKCDAFKRPGYVIITEDCCGGILREVPETAVYHAEPIGHDGKRLIRPCPRREEG